MTDKFAIRITKDSMYIIDTETGREINLHDKYEAQRLCNLLNDMYNTIKTGWGYK